jgi:hypothetical protein
MTRRVDFNRLEKQLEEKSSGTIRCTFKDSTGATFAPTTVNWTLTDLSGTTYATGSPTPSAVVDILLYDTDLELSEGFLGDAEERILLVEATYNSGDITGVPLRDSCRFNVRNLIPVT